MPHRIFLAINLPSQARRKLSEYSSRWAEIPASWVREDKLHITLEFIGRTSDEEVVEICKITKEIASRHSPFTLMLQSILYGPTDKFPPRLIWARGEKSEELTSLKKDIVNTLNQSEKLRVHLGGMKSFSPHVTLARIRQMELKRMDSEEIPQINENIDVAFEVYSIEVMESELQRGSSLYTILESSQLTN